MSSTAMSRNPRWSIGILRVRSLFGLSEALQRSMPTISVEDITDVDAQFVADPFLARSESIWHVFFEVYDSRTSRGVIGHATSEDAAHWRYTGVVLRESGHLSYPFIFYYNGDWYMMPETLSRGGVFLYRCRRFPGDWEVVSQLASGELADPTLIRHAGRWWLFACPSPRGNDQLCIYSAGSLLGPWVSHPGNPVLTHNPVAARPAGRMIHYNGRLLRFAQDCSTYYGRMVTAFTVERLDLENYNQSSSGQVILAGGESAWNGDGMHHIDPWNLSPDHWVVAVDGHCFTA